MSCEYLVKGIKRSRPYVIPPVDPDDAKLKHLCNKIEGPNNYIEDDKYFTYCNNDHCINCLVFKYMNNRCENLLLTETWEGKHKEPTFDLDGTKYKPICKKSKNIKHEDYFVYCDDDNYVNCPTFKDEINS